MRFTEDELWEASPVWHLIIPRHRMGDGGRGRQKQEEHRMKEPPTGAGATAAGAAGREQGYLFFAYIA